MKAVIKFNRAQQEMVISAMRTFRLTLKGANRKMFDLVYGKLLTLEKGKKIKLDAMELFYISQALRRKSKLHWAIGKLYEYKHYAQLADEVEEVRVAFQNTYLTKIKKAQTAATVHAS
ncbi:hypothetical protein [Desertibacillus haloalkaliphilus]|uniref:hypothetical protein n=1 Tax=Desertibacillus haloalkaliphilus TaxID=1328930 RepID=UPI001C274F85|nr:hypothetical protein [Desertibacillus haloalkaliphilus]MBU8908547.1 hypothetical protein [Desertibacillus haloalkaliphilus]